jgi:hypothetical protein
VVPPAPVVAVYVSPVGQPLGWVGWLACRNVTVRPGWPTPRRWTLTRTLATGTVTAYVGCSGRRSIDACDVTALLASTHDPTFTAYVSGNRFDTEPGRPVAQASVTVPPHAGSVYSAR